MLLPQNDALAANAPSNVKRVDYRANDAASTSRVRVVEKYHWQPGLQCLAGGKTECARQHFSFILNWVPNHPYALMKMSSLENRLNRPKVADRYFDDALMYAPTDPAVHIVYGIHLQRSNRLKTAIQQYEKAIELEPNQSEAHYNLGLAYVEAGKLDKANEHAQVAYRLGYGLPGLRDQLKQRGAWKETQAAPEKTNPERPADAQ